jgi:LPXTG-motif cell wall-anchored protein
VKDRIVLMLALLAGALSITLGVATAAGATGTGAIVRKADIVNTPDDGCNPWARGTFLRTVIISKSSTTGVGAEAVSTWLVTLTDEGTFAAQANAATPGDPAKHLPAAITGDLHGEGHYVVTGQLKTDHVGQTVPTYDNSAYACKADVPANLQTGTWPLRYFKDGATTTGIKGWTWTYTTKCEKRTETESGAQGNITKVCPAPPTSTTATPAATATVTPTATATVTPTQPVTPGPTTPAAHPTQTLVAQTGSLPVTGPGDVIWTAGIGGALVVAGAGGILLSRRKRERFTTE